MLDDLGSAPSTGIHGIQFIPFPVTVKISSLPLHLQAICSLMFSHSHPISKVLRSEVVAVAVVT